MLEDSNIKILMLNEDEEIPTATATIQVSGEGISRTINLIGKRPHNTINLYETDKYINDSPIEIKFNTAGTYKIHIN